MTVDVITVDDRWGLRGGTKANLATVNPIPLNREAMIETDTGLMKVGNGVDRWLDLQYINLGFIDLTGIADGYVPTWDAVNNRFAAEAPAGGSGSGAWALVKKIADEARNSTTTLANDGSLSLALSATSLYRLRVFVLFNTANATMGIKYAFNYTGAVGNVYRRIVLQRPGRGVPAGTDNELVGTDSGIVGSNALIDTTFGVGLIECEYVIHATTAGTFSFQWAQNVSNASDCTVLGGSYIEWAKFA